MLERIAATAIPDLGKKSICLRFLSRLVVLRAEKAQRFLVEFFRRTDHSYYFRDTTLTIFDGVMR